MADADAHDVSPEVDDYLAALPDAERDVLDALRAAVREVVPEAHEVISYGVPTFRTRVGIVGYGAFADHCSLFAMSGEVLAPFGRELEGWSVSKGTVRFTVDHPLPADVIQRIVRARLAENDARRLH